MQLAGRHGDAVPETELGESAPPEAPVDCLALPAGSLGVGGPSPRAADRAKTGDGPVAGVFPADAQATVRDRLVEACATCRSSTLQHLCDVVTSTWAPPATRFPWRQRFEKTARRGLWRVCTQCGCAFPLDAAARDLAARRGGEHLDPTRPGGRTGGGR